MICVEMADPPKGPQFRDTPVSDPCTVIRLLSRVSVTVDGVWIIECIVTCYPGNASNNLWILDFMLGLLDISSGGQSASLSWNKAPIWGLRPDIYYFLTITVLLLSSALSDEMTGLSFVHATGPRQRSGTGHIENSFVVGIT
jgi:hypothetical protein